MAETLLSPGVLTRENDISQINQGPISSGTAIVGPTVKGPVNIPTIVTSYSDFLNKFGGSFKDGNIKSEYLTSITAYKFFEQGGETLLVTRVVSGSFSPATSTPQNSLGSSSFTLETLSEGEIMNNSGSEGTNNTLPSGTIDNIRWEIPSINVNNGTFNLLIRRGNDKSNAKTILESWSNLSLDPLSPNYIESVIGNQNEVFSSNQINYQGEYPVRSKYIRVSSVTNPTYEYFDNNGDPKPELSGSIPVVSSGSFSGATGTLVSAVSASSDITHNDYTSSLGLLSNKDEYRFHTLVIPGKTQSSHSDTVALVVSTCVERGDALAVIDVTDKGATVSTAISEASEIDSSYAATYYPWVQVNSPNTGKLTWVPPSVIIPSVFAYSDRISAPYFAPAGFKRGGISIVQPELKLNVSQRDSLYLGKVNPIVMFPGQGPVVWGQKTLQSKASALDRINVRKLLIELKTEIGRIGNSLVFENNTQSTRNSFLAQVRPYLDSIQQKGGLYAYQVVMDDSNNTNDIIDRNQILGQIHIQPSKVAEFVLLDFTVSPTGSTFLD